MIYQLIGDDGMTSCDMRKQYSRGSSISGGSSLIFSGYCSKSDKSMFLVRFLGWFYCLVSILDLGLCFRLYLFGKN